MGDSRATFPAVLAPKLSINVISRFFFFVCVLAVVGHRGFAIILTQDSFRSFWGPGVGPVRAEKSNQLNFLWPKWPVWDPLFDPPKMFMWVPFLRPFPGNEAHIFLLVGPRSQC